MRSVLHLLKTVLEEEESGTLIGLLLLVGEAESTLVVHLVSNEELELIELASDQLDKLGGALLEEGDSLRLSLFVKFGDDLGEVASSPRHELSLAEALNLIKLELVLDVDDGLTLFLVLLFLIGGNLDVIGTLCNVLSFGLNAGVLKLNFVRE